jgi:aldehyde:ferredoxin oxidoreductase
LAIEEITGGYAGKILRVDLTKNLTSVENIDTMFCRKYLGGMGFISYFLFKELTANVDPLSPENKIVFALGPATGTSLIGGGRHSVGARSPLGGGIAISEAGGYWGAELKHAGYDGIIIEGKAQKPVYLWVNDGKAVLKNAEHLWGKNTRETQEIIKTELADDKIQMALIGPGGENLVRFACIMHGLHQTAGRGGLGAVMGSKNLKAIAVRGTQPVKVADPARLKELNKWWMANRYPAMVKVFHEYGTGGPEIVVQEQAGNLPVRNFRDGLFPGVEKIHGGVIKDTIRVGMTGCYACPLRCKKMISFQEPYVVDPKYGGPEYETLASLGSNCGIDNLKAIVKGNELCNAYSIDTISTGGVIAFAMECFERGSLNTGDTGGLQLRFGDADAMLKAIELIARREGFGNELAEGSARLAKKIGNGSEEFAIQVKGVDAGLHEPRLKPGLGLGYMVNPNGADHCLSVQDDKYASQPGLRDMRPIGLLEPLPLNNIGAQKVALFKNEQARRVIFNSLVMCYFVGGSFSMEQISDIIAAITGWDTSPVEQLRMSERILTTARMFNIRHGLTIDDDKLPKRFFTPKTDGALSQTSLDPEKMNQAARYYYILMGWDPETGVPLPEKLEELGIV